MAVRWICPWDITAGNVCFIMTIKWPDCYNQATSCNLQVRFPTEEEIYFLIPSSFWAMMAR